MIRKLGKETPKPKNDYHRPNDTWVEQPLSYGVPEADGASQRVRSLRSKRKIFTLAVTAFTVGALLILGTSEYKNDFLAPGPLCSSHAQILAGQGADRCAACHGASDTSLAGWVADTLTGGRTIPVSQSELCMKCHENSISPDFALNPHSVAVDELKKRTEKFKQVSSTASGSMLQSLGSVVTGAHSGSHAEIACSACHREHHGAASLTSVTDQQCQSCHAQSFDSFEGNHPEFTNWPQQRRSKIAFDHSTHGMKHFPSKATEFNCNQCHVDGPYGNVKLLASFEQSCAACHEDQIHQSGESGLAIFSLPSIDPEAIEEQKLEIGGWPMAATGDFDGRIPPAMRLLLQADPAAQKVLDAWNQKFGSTIDFADVDPESAADVAQAVELVWAIKRLLYELATDGEEALRVRLGQALGNDVSLDQVMMLASQLDKGVFQNTVRRWLPDLQTEIAQRNADGVSQSKSWSRTSGRAEKLVATFRNVRFSKLVRADEGLLIENPLRELLSVGRSPGASLGDAATNEMAVKQSVAKSPAKPASKKPLMLREQTAGDVPADADLLAVNPLAGGGLSDGPLPAPPSDDLSGEQTGQAGAVGTKSGSKSSVAKWESPGVTRAGWYRDDELFRVFYRPGGHEDSCLKAWSDLVSSATEANQRPDFQPLFEQLLSDQGVGMCATCHTVDQQSDASFVVNWRPEYRDPSVGSFTKFSHQPHTLQPHLRDCSACHDMSQPISNKDSFTSHDSSDVVSNFAPITKMNCVSCHHKGGTNSGCSHCHSYHVESNAIPSSVDHRTENESRTSAQR